MKHLIVVDYSNLAYRALFANSSRGKGKELVQEALMDIVKGVWQAHTINKDAFLLLAMDYGPTKKAEFYSWWYKKHHRVAMDDQGQEWLWVDGKKPIPLPFTGDLSPKDPGPKALPDNKIVTDLLPKYKGKRAAWAFDELPKDLWMATIKNQAMRLRADWHLLTPKGSGPLQVWGAEGYEADDIAWTAAKHYDKVDFISTDEDWKLLGLRNAEVYRRTGTESVMPQRVTREEALRTYYTKIIAGDVSDNIASLTPLQGKKRYGAKRAAELVNECKTPQDVQEVLKMFWKPSVERNIQLVKMLEVPYLDIQRTRQPVVGLTAIEEKDIPKRLRMEWEASVWL